MSDHENQNETATAVGRAVIYLRVSSSQQADKDYDPEGFSIPAQRDACTRKAEAINTVVVEEFVDRGESAKTANRAGLQALLSRLEEGDITHVVCHKVDRLARSRADDIQIVMKIRQHGAQLVSATENIDESPSGLLLHGIMSSIAEFYSRNLATEIMKGTTQKAKTGGTPFRAPLGYLNTREWVDGREIRTITIDPERAPLVKLAFELYATGDYSLSELAGLLEARGLRSRPSRRKIAKTLDTNRLSAILRNDYYIGVVRYAGAVNPGRHQPLVEHALFHKVQELLEARRQAGERNWRNHHYLRGSLVCAQCGRRLFFNRARGRRGGLYDYLVCGGRHTGICTQPYHRADAIEQAVERHYTTIQLTDEERDRIRAAVHKHLHALAKVASKETARARAELTRLDNEERKLLNSHYADTISPHIYAEEQERVRAERAAAENLLSRYQLNEDETKRALETALELTNDIQAAYLNADPLERRLLNQAFFKHLEIDTEDIANDELNPPFAQLHALAALTRPQKRPQKGRTPAPAKAGGSYLPLMVDLNGLEPGHNGPATTDG